MGIRLTPVHSGLFSANHVCPKACMLCFPSDCHPAEAKASPHKVTAHGLRLQAAHWVLWHVGEGVTKLVSEARRRNW